MFEFFKQAVIGVGLSYHVGHCDNCNMVNPYAMLYFRDEMEWADAGIVAFKNSHSNLSVGPFFSFGNDKVFGEFALVTGYEYLSGSFMTPAARVGVHLNDYVNVYAFPSPHDGKLGVGVGVQVGYPIKW